MWVRALLPLIALAGCDRLFRIESFADANPNAIGSGSTGPRIVFVTSTSYIGGLLDGVAGADRTCQNIATGVHLPAGAYRAWLSTPAQTVASRMTQSGGPFVLVDGTPIATDWQALTTSNLMHPIAENELGNHVDGAGCDVWTNTTQEGLEASPNPPDDCYDWTTLDQGAAPGMGSIVDVDARWTARYPCPIPCASSARLYCFQQ